MSPVITRLEREHARSRRVILELDGERIRLMPALLANRLGLQVGDQLDEAQLAEQASRIEQGLARERALYLLSYRERSCGELLSKLTDDGYGPELATSLVADLAERGLVDDHRFTESMVRTLSARGYGRPRIARELAKYRIEPGLADGILDAALPTDDEHARALLIARKAVRGRTMDVGRLAGRLARKGFRPAVALGAAREALDDEVDSGCEGADEFDAG